MKKWILLGILNSCCFSTYIAQTIVKDDTTKVVWNTPQGSFQGRVEDKVYRLQGIRYATAERYEYPKTVSYFHKYVKAIYNPPVSPQSHSEGEELMFPKYYKKNKIDEKPQYLSITIPKGLKPGEKVPVMVWIHGGSYVSGSINRKGYNPTEIVSEHRVIFVNIAYRLGVLGYLRDRQGALANLGLLDQIEALKWIKQNISNFGGDNQNITIFGESAGADAVWHLMIADGTKDLFQRVIIQSAPFGVYTRSRNKMVQKMLKEYNTLNIDADLSTILAKQKELLENNKNRGLAKLMPMSPRYGVYPLPQKEQLPQAWQEATDRLDVLIGANTNEVSFFVASNPKLTKLIQKPIVGSVMRVVMRKLGKKIFVKGAYNFAHHYAKSKGKMYYYNLSWGEGKHLVGGGHTIELPLLFGAKYYEDSPLLMGKTVEEVDSFGKQLRKVWVDFAKTGKVNTSKIDQVIEIKELN